MKDEFISIREWINESENKRQSYGCVMLDANMNIDEWTELHTDGIDEDDIYESETDDDFGIEDNPHTTLIYGIHEDEIDPEVIMSTIKDDLYPLTLEVSKISIFENEDFDVVKYDIPLTDDLVKFRKLFEESFPNTQSYPDFHPHMTLAYVKPGKGKKYVKTLDEPFEITLDKGVYSFHEIDEDGEEQRIRKEHKFMDHEKEMDNFII